MIKYQNVITAPEPLHSALKELVASTRHMNLTWLVGGSTGLMLQGAALSAAPRDLDLYIDREQAPVMHKALAHFSTDEQIESETAIYSSILSHYEVAGVKVELVGAFEVRAMDSVYRVEAGYLAAEHAVRGSLHDGTVIHLMPLMHEMIFNMLRNRPDRYHAIADICRKSGLDIHRTVLEKLAERNQFSAELIARLKQLLEYTGE
ncbi:MULTISPECIES: nucleotidyltransferase domain-containing protein [Paenibacillus]|uniref:nucleotidyltransferase domain-containing protein n=1 Tax=Paenibacillus TaxID=44249 RepID=UPI0010AFC6CC|nr:MULTISPECIES: hypothetical protein [Paenibacillus]NTZ17695.1 hypothetical protein [Paenibacillus sp. JMULE4]GCL70488.1 hypothetical protein PN4B1_03900 [Paenibacillus naphthalenovorans]